MHWYLLGFPAVGQNLIPVILNVFKICIIPVFLNVFKTKSKQKAFYNEQRFIQFLPAIFFLFVCMHSFLQFELIGVISNFYIIYQIKWKENFEGLYRYTNTAGNLWFCKECIGNTTK